MVKNKALKKIAFLFRWIANHFALMASWLERREYLDDTKSKFVDLAPTDDADEEGIYSKAILFALSKPEISNIALTGPYGSGKSSIIQTFLKKHSLPVLQISLAAFVPEVEKPEIISKQKEVSRQEIERSILQQMLYGADANKLPLSRFKRIQTPGFFSFLKSLYILAGALAFWFVFQQREGIIESFINGALFFPHTPADWFDLVSVVLTVAFLWSAVHYFYIASFGLSLKSLSLKDVEIRPASDDHTSILNRHLDEIIYFFQSTEYELVIIEDLDRFNNPDVFVTLREINRLVNQNAGVKRTVRFLYALRDDMFVNTERTKFFEFIIPVIPIINTSNSIDMMLKQGERLEIDERLDKQFLREVSRYLNDLRLIQNIFNEYAVYVANLEIDGENVLNVNKLLAILIYKNVYPRDFELLHRNEGKLAKVLELKSELVKSGEARYRDEIIEIERQLEVAERQVPSDLKELRQIYVMALIEKHVINNGNVSFKLEQGPWMELSKLVSYDNFDRLIQSSSLLYRSSNGYGQQRIDISSLQNEVNPNKSYKQRKAEIEVKAADNKSKKLQRINELRAKIAMLRMAKLNELLRLDDESTQKLFKDFGEGWELARFLILEGYLDDTYYQFTSLFHAGRLSPNDNKFLIQIRAYVTPEPGFPIDNPKEVIAAMREEDFGQSYVLNVKIVDTILSESASYSPQRNKLFEFIAADFENCEDFFDAYYVNGQDVKGFLYELVRVWEGFIPNAIKSSKNIIHITKLVTNLPEKTLKKLANDFNELSKFVAEHLPEILDRAPEIETERLISLDFDVKNLTEIKDRSEIVRAMFEKGRFELTIANLEYIYQETLGKSDLQLFNESNFTVLRSINNPALMKQIDNRFDAYVSNILLALPDNSKEDVSAIIAVINHDDLERDKICEFLKKQTNKLPTLDDVPKAFFSMLFELNAVEPTWKNCLAFMDREEFQEEELISYLDREDVRAEILKQPLSGGSDSLSLRQLLIKADSMSDEAYSEYTHAQPTSFKSFPKELALSKRRILIDEEKIAFSKDNLDYLNESKELQVLFVSKNIDKYLLEPDSFELDDDFRESLLQTKVSDAVKLKLIELMDLKTLADFPDRAVLIGSIIKHLDDMPSNLNGAALQVIIMHSSPIETQVALLNKNYNLIDDDEVRYILASMSKPYSKINIGGHTPKLKNNNYNKTLVKWLDERNIISSFKLAGFKDDKIKVNLYRK